MKTIRKIFPLNKLSVLIRLTHITITGIPIELGCIIISYIVYLYTKQNEWLYYGVPIITILHHSNKSKYYYVTPILYFLYMAYVCNIGFPNTLLCTSLLTAIIYLCLVSKKPISIRIYQLSKHFLISTYFSTLILLGLVCLYIVASMFITDPEKLKTALSYATIFIFSIVLPALFLAIDKYRKNETVQIPAIIKWAHLLIVETSILIGTIYINYFILLMTFNSLTPRPYVIYILIVLMLIIESCAKLHEWAPRSWNNFFFQKRNLIYIPLILLGAASLYLEFSLIGLTPRTLIASLLLMWITVISISRLTNFHFIVRNERITTLYMSTGMLIAIFISTAIQ